MRRGVRGPDLLENRAALGDLEAVALSPVANVTCRGTRGTASLAGTTGPVAAVGTGVGQGTAQAHHAGLSRA